MDRFIVVLVFAPRVFGDCTCYPKMRVSIAYQLGIITELAFLYSCADTCTSIVGERESRRMSRQNFLFLGKLYHLFIFHGIHGTKKSVAGLSPGRIILISHRPIVLLQNI